MTIISQENQPLWQLLLTAFPESNRTRIKKMISLGCVSINRAVVRRADVPVAKGQKVEFRKYEPRKQHREKAPFSIVFEDDFFLAVIKPAGILSSGRTTEKTRSMLGMVRSYLKTRERRDVEVFVVHRLDREVSGLLLFAKTERVQQWFKDNWNSVEKYYYALVNAVPSAKKGTIDTFLCEDDRQKMQVSVQGGESAMRAVTHYKVKETHGDYSLLEVQLETGRKNQIRVHLAHIGHSIVGDFKYGKKSNIQTDGICLFAYLLIFPHPITNRRIKIEINPPNWSKI
ncbi:MAG: RluA family pseudouridine synthase [Bacteroidales bacterium]|jgi:23S rRNA pseudouridine1911/1915/1917 synthase|nr:RluA family pseudouridine synthase [Bacteroidales bacterium]